MAAMQCRVARRSIINSGTSSESGFTLIELLVAIAVGLVVTLAVLIMQAKLTRQNVRASDTSLRDNEARAAMDVISRDLTGAGFLLAGTPEQCTSVLQFNAGLAGTQYFVSYPVSAMPAGNGTSLPFVAGTGISLNYPASGSTNRSDVLVIRSTADASQMSSATTPLIPLAPSAAFASFLTGLLPFQPSPPPPLASGDVGILLAGVGPALFTDVACLRIPVASVGALAGKTSLISGGALMPNNFYAGFSAQLPLLGFPATHSLFDASIQASKFVNLGQASATNQRTFAYFVDKTNYPWPTLVRAAINPLTDLEIPNSRQELAAGVVSFQALFGIGNATTGVTSYQTWANVLASGNTGRVMTVKIMVLSRSIYKDPGFRDSVTTSTVNIRGQFGQTGYTDYVIPADELSNHFVAQEAELAVRRRTWN